MSRAGDKKAPPLSTKSGWVPLSALVWEDCYIYYLVLTNYKFSLCSRKTLVGLGANDTLADLEVAPGVPFVLSQPDRPRVLAEAGLEYE